ncbi:hypothetical protein NOR_05196 [Metarhizium rileyi]|uniref:DUF1996 domain-containing protein n=1 Tax=Metarhizium rileyi (strain RCEF 4871) TaxID=1649241 RepID=A0A162JAN2_METRR|nr:hypothetical protein NOR_05196 [Metarhizium rileyi RCEF 4871]TWU73417.1 hypothetical protein ED733_003813 [Metarhizium rileyi]
MLRSVALSAGLVAGANAFWRMECPGRTALARMDPIVNPNQVSPHEHTIHGSSGFFEGANSSDLLAGSCTSCRVSQDKSAYWTPTVYFQDEKTGDLEMVSQVGGMLAYYLLYGQNIVAFPPGFRMIAGTNERRNYTLGDPAQPDPDKWRWASLGQTSQEDLAQRAIGFNCLNYAKTPAEPTLYRHTLPEKSWLDKHCTNGVRFELMFPSCWDGKSTDSKNHKDHMAFPTLVMDGTCPDSHPVRTPSMLFETIWDTYAFKGREGKFVVSNGDTTGNGYHGDFMTGWDPDFLQKAINTCTNLSGRIQDCPIFDVMDQGKAASCKLQKPPIVSGGDARKPMKELPGGIKVGGIVGTHDDNKPAAKTTQASPSQASPSPVQHSVVKSPVAAVLPGLAFKEQAPSSPVPQPPTTSVAPTTAPPAPPAPAATASTGPSFYTTGYITESDRVIEILWMKKEVTTTVYVESPAPTPVGGLEHRRRHVHRGHVHGKL